MLIDDFDFDLPPERIAQVPAAERDAARLLHVTGQALADRRVRDLPELLQPGDLLVYNDTKVIPARLFGHRGEVAVEVLLHKQMGVDTWRAFARPAKRLRPGDVVRFADGFEAAVVERVPDGEVILRFSAGGADLWEALARFGEVPLPPYIKRPDHPTDEDRLRYQTVYARAEGSVAAPTAGLHFTPELLAALDARGIERVAVTLHVGAGTFLPVKTERVEAHRMHAEWGQVGAAAVDAVERTRRRGGRVAAVGTTSLRLLESAAREDGTLAPFSGETDLFILPGYRFKAVDRLMTNFHLPRSTLFMLVCAFAGQAVMHRAYRHAIDAGYRFYSYGDSSLLERAA